MSCPTSHVVLYPTSHVVQYPTLHVVVQYLTWKLKLFIKYHPPPSVRPIRLLTKMLMNISTNLQSWALATTVATT